MRASAACFFGSSPRSLKGDLFFLFIKGLGCEVGNSLQSGGLEVGSMEDEAGSRKHEAGSMKDGAGRGKHEAWRTKRKGWNKLYEV
ncbi:hypothetical protein [Sinomicrobium sp. M5D2P17]